MFFQCNKNLKEKLMEISKRKRKEKLPILKLVTPNLGKLPSRLQAFLCLHEDPNPPSLHNISTPWWGWRAAAMNGNSPVVLREKQPQSFLPWRHIWDMNGLFMTLQFRPSPAGQALCMAGKEAARGSAESLKEPVVVWTRRSWRRKRPKERGQMCKPEQTTS